MPEKLTRRSMLWQTGCATAWACAATGASASAASADTADSAAPPAFRYCMNTSTIARPGLELPELVDVVARAGYTGIEPWLRDLESYTRGGGSLADLRQRIADRGLTVESAIGFAPWIAEEEDRRAAGVEQMKREMDTIAQIGGTRIAAPPAGVRELPANLDQVAERYRVILDAGRQIGVIPQVEVWGFSKVLRTLAEAIYVAVAADHPDACLLLDVVHLHTGGSGFEGLQLINGRRMHCFHINDYPEQPDPQIKGGGRVLPGEGVAPLAKILGSLHASGFGGALSLELFNETYHRMDALEAARLGLAKMREAVARSGLTP